MIQTENEVVFTVLANCSKIHSIHNVFMIKTIFYEFLMRNEKIIWRQHGRQLISLSKAPVTPIVRR